MIVAPGKHFSEFSEGERTSAVRSLILQFFILTKPIIPPFRHSNIPGWCNATSLVRCIIFFTLLFLLHGISGCPGKNSPKGGTYFAVMFRAAFNPYFEEMEKGIRDTAAANKIKVIVLANDKMGGSEQDDIFRKLVELKIKALIIMPESQDLAVKHCIPLILEANRLKIPVIFIHSIISDENLEKYEAKVECRISCDNIRGGTLAAEYIGDKLKGKGKVLLLEGSAHSIPGIRRSEGFTRTLKNYPEIRLVKSPYGNWNRDEGFRSCREIFDKEKDIAAIFAHNDLMAIGASDAADFAKVRKPLIVGFDGTKQGIKAVEEGRIDATVDQGPYEIGKLGVMNALKIIRGESVPSQIYTKTDLITKENLKMPFK